MKKVNKEIFERLKTAYPDARCELDFRTPFQLVVSTILSAQATDVQVNKVTEGLFAQYPDLDSWMNFSIEEIEEKIKTIGLYKNKAKNIYNLLRELKERHNGEVPRTMEELTALSGVGRKTANVVMANAFGIPALAVDTHVFRVSNRIGLADEKTVEKTESSLCKAIDKDKWILMHHLLIFHGRRTCNARNPKCESCVLNDLCKYNRNEKSKTEKK